MTTTPPRRRTAATRLAGLLILLALAGCAAGPAPLATWVVLGEDGAASARAAMTGPACPAIDIDGQARPMQVRAPAATLPPRGGAGAAAARPVSFPLVCEAALPVTARSARVAGVPLPLPHLPVRRIVVLGDTGCRMVAASASFQDCNDAAAYPFAAIAARAAATAPDLVIHVGDYLYREDPCPSGHPGCAGSPWGHGWDAWAADWFGPAAPLLRAAPLVAARGNHETCARAGVGYWRLLDPRPLQPGRDCLGPAGAGEHGAPYAVPLGAGAQLVVFDSANTDYHGLAAADPRRLAFERDWEEMARLAARAPYTIGVLHHPLLAYGARRGAGGARQLYGGDRGLIDAFAPHSARLFPPTVQLVLSGHAHLWEQLSFASGHPSQLVAGFSGTSEDVEPLPATPPPDLPPAPGALVEALSSWVGGFGFMTLERSGPDQWEARIWDRAGRLRNSCRIAGRHSRCALAQVPAAAPAAVTP